jgi:hypothetical protein
MHIRPFRVDPRKRLFFAVARLSRLRYAEETERKNDFEENPNRLRTTTLGGILSRALAGPILVACPATIAFHAFRIAAAFGLRTSDKDVFWATLIIAAIVGPHRWIGAWAFAPVGFAVTWIAHTRKAAAWYVPSNRSLLTSYGSLAGLMSAWAVHQRFQTPYASAVAALIIILATSL